MLEDMNRHEAELNEHALENVSGGYNHRDEVYAATKVCHSCYTDKPSKRDCYNAHQDDLAHYLLEHGMDCVKVPPQCPYYKS